MTDTSGQYPDPEAIRQKRIAELEQRLGFVRQQLQHSNVFKPGHSNLERQEHEIRAELSRLRNEQPKGGDAAIPHIESPYKRLKDMTSGPGSECDRSGACPSPEPQDVREALENAAMECERQRTGPIVSSVDEAMIHNAACDKCANAVRVLAALAQSDAQPVGWDKIVNLARSHAVWMIDGIRGYTCEFAPDPAQHKHEYDVAETHLLQAMQALYTAPPRPDASGLIEAAEWRNIESAPKDGTDILLKTDVGIFPGKWDLGRSRWSVMVGEQSDWVYAPSDWFPLPRSRAADRSAPRSDTGGA